MKLTSPKTPTSETEPKTSGKSKRAASTKKAAKPAVSDDEETEPETKEPEKPVDQSEVKAKREKEGTIPFVVFFYIGPQVLILYSPLHPPQTSEGIHLT